MSLPQARLHGGPLGEAVVALGLSTEPGQAPCRPPGSPTQARKLAIRPLRRELVQVKLIERLSPEQVAA